MFYANPEVDRLYEEAISTTDLEGRVALLEDAISICNADAAWTPLYVYEQISAQATGLTGIEVLPKQETRFGAAKYE